MPGTNANHVHQVDCFIIFCNNYCLKFINPSPSTLYYFITHLSATFSSSKSIRNYVSRVRFLHKHLGLSLKVLDSFQVSSLMWAADLNMHLCNACPSCPTSSPSLASSPPDWAPWDLP